MEADPCRTRGSLGSAARPRARPNPVAAGLRVVPRFAMICNTLSSKFARHFMRVIKEFFWRG